MVDLVMSVWATCFSFVVPLFCLLHIVIVSGVVLSPKMILGKFEWFVFFGISSLASATDAAEVDVVGDFGSGLAFLPLFGGRLCHLGSDKLSSRSDVPCQFEDVSFLPRGSFDLSSVGMKPPLKPFVFFLFSFVCVIAANALIEVLWQILQFKFS